MEELNTSFLNQQINSVSEDKNKIQWLLDQGLSAMRIANPGCKYGYETLALMWTFRAEEAFGLDIDEVVITQAKMLHFEIKQEVRQIASGLRRRQTLKNERDWWNSIPMFFKRDILKETFKVEFEQGDLAQNTGQEPNYFDIAFCRRVLHHIWYDEGREKPQGDTQTAINEMARIVRPGGIVASDSIVQFEDKPKANFSELFKRVGLNFVYREEREVFSPEGPALAERYIFQKPNPAK